MADPTYDRERASAGAEDPQPEPGASAERVQREFRRAREDTEAVVEDLRKLSAELGSLLRERLESHPYLTLGASAGIGYVLGGGLPKGSPALAIGLTTRMAASWLLRELGGSAVGHAHATGEEE
jgi:hypothetical protein